MILMFFSALGFLDLGTIFLIFHGCSIESTEGLKNDQLFILAFLLSAALFLRNFIGS